MRVPEGRSTRQSGAGKGQPGHRVDAGHLQRRRPVEIREEPREAGGEHRLSGSWGAHQQQVVATGGGHLERPPGETLSTDIGQVGSGQRLSPGVSRLTGPILSFDRR